ncbi:protein TPX2 isoform X2 [Capsicum annuum]|uniref:protein TPX2 isoform X2 n=1 Tax=Capsicum annuum TaxID=4072 RepID=UPI001FB0F1FA|nr:protein TPX2 isoform X2 [Capsicum annuum]
MEEDMEDMIEYTFTAVEIDLDYEFDAPKYFDFSSGESFPVRSLSESWFDSAESYPDSPFVTRLISKESGLLENINISPKSKIENMSLSDSDSDIEVEQEVPAVLQGEGNNAGIAAHVEISNAEKLLNQLRQQLPSGLTFYDHIAKGATRGKTRCLVKPSCPRSSTLMKPTASHLAKQSLPRPTGESRLPTFLVEKNGTISTVIETQAAKRQKLESGHLRKVDEAKPVFSFVHKEPKRDGKVDRNNTLAKTRITIPREPDLQTTHRALRARPKGSEQAENMPPTTIRRFKALPLNRKIFEGPSLPPKRSNPQLPQFQEFHLKTSERAVQHRSAVSTFAANSSSTNDKVLPKASTNSTMECGNREFRRVNHVEAPKQEESVSTYHFKALPLNKKILSSKGDIGVFRNTKKETTVPMEFNFHTVKRIQHNPPIDLFNKLSLASEPQPAGGVQLKAQRPSCHLSKKIDGLISNKTMSTHGDRKTSRSQKQSQFSSVVMWITEVCQVFNTINRIWAFLGQNAAHFWMSMNPFLRDSQDRLRHITIV